jgi:hypothetical protein
MTYRLANERARIPPGTPAKLLRQSKHFTMRGVVTNGRLRQSNAGRKNTGLSRTITITLSPPRRENVVARGKLEKPGVTTALRPKPFGKVVERFERAPSAAASLPSIATIAAASTKIRSIAVNMFGNPSTAPSLSHATEIYYRA